MNYRSLKLIYFAAFVAFSAVVYFLIQSIETNQLRSRSNDSIVTTNPDSSPGDSPVERIEFGDANTQVIEDGHKTISDKLTGNVDRWAQVARGTDIPLILPETLSINPAIVALLGLNPTQQDSLRRSVEGFMNSLKNEEIAHAFIESSESGEEIVIPPFDRSQLVQKFRRELEMKLGDDVAGFLSDQILFDRSLAVGGSEIRLSIATAENGIDHLTITQQALRKDAVDSSTPIRSGDFNISPTYELRTTLPVKKNVSYRYEHLFSAAETLPRRVANQ